MKVNIFTLTWNALDKLTRLKESLIPALKDIDYEWFIKDNYSTDNTLSVASHWGKNIHVIPYKNNNQNFAEGMNFLVETAKPNDKDLMLLLNNDIVFNDVNSIKNMIDIIKKNSKVGVVGARLLYLNSNKIQHAGIIFNDIDQLPFNFKDLQPNDEQAEKNRLFQSVTGAVLLTRTNLYKESCKTNRSGISGMDEQYHWSFDDVDLCLNIKYNMNYDIVYCGKTNIFHESSYSLKKNPANLLFFGHNIFHFRKKWANRYMLDQKKYIINPKYNLYKYER
jgi:GT2 family glycosyltransferase